MEGNLINFVRKTREFKRECLNLMDNLQMDRGRLSGQESRKLGEQNVLSVSASLISNAEEEDAEERNKCDAEEREAILAGVELCEVSELTRRLRLKLSPINRLDDPIFEVLKFLSRKALTNSVQLTSRRFNKVINGTEEHWPKFKFGRLILSTDEDLKRTTKYWMFKNRKELKVPPVELAPILCSLDAMTIRVDAKNKIMDPVHLVTHYSGAADSVQPRSVYFFLNLDEKDTEDGGGEEEEQFQVLRLSGKGNDRFFINLPNKLDTKMAIAAAIYWFRQLSKVHFVSVHFEQFRWTRPFFDFLASFGISKFLPISADVFKSYNPVSVNFLRTAIRANSSTLWEIRGTLEFLQYLIELGEGEEEDSRNGRARRTPSESKFTRVWGFVPLQIPHDSAYGGETTFFDALIYHAKNCKKPEKICARIDLNFKQEPAHWVKIVQGMQLIYKSQTLKVDEEDGTEDEAIEVRYRIRNATGPRKFEVRVECKPEMFGQQMYSFALILEEEDEEKQ